ncbi:DUF4349 domain-containing protein [Aeromicrobium sp. A1-2]|uniref:DUF4349 domain-containing protein n=1 Tax=Aeromicrobium sp. A1-2 TaxID=2107713 RepID=UPI000E54526A|nr:DUF4349 domain-containing protein [Aeromicrobium sp. A1-2]AXT85891.1 DUF4349 domain-containing protein [Aeromicrobium sp. A1-2]
MTTPTLHDDRIAAMRGSVMHSVDQDIGRRGRRTRRTIGLAAAGVLVVGTAGIGVGLLDAGGGSSSDSSSSQAGGSRALEGAAAPQDSADTASKAAAPEDDREVVTTGQITVTVKQPRAVAQQISAYVETLGGRVDNRSENGSGGDASAVLTVRVPSSEVTSTIERLSTYGSVENVSLQNDDVTGQARDLDARIDALQLSIDRLGQIMSKAESSSELIKAEAALTQRQAEIESLKAQRKGIADQVSLSTLSIELFQADRPDSVEPGGFTGGLTDGWNALVSTVNRIVEVAGVLLPWAAISALLYGAYRLVARRRGRS